MERQAQTGLRFVKRWSTALDDRVRDEHEAMEGETVPVNSVVATIENHVGDGVQHTPLPVTHERFDTEEDAHAFGMAQANQYLDKATPAA